MEDIIIMVQIHKFFLHLSLFTGVLFWVIFCQFLSNYFFEILLFLKNNLFALIIFLWMYLFRRYLTNEFFLQHLFEVLSVVQIFFLYYSHCRSAKKHVSWAKFEYTIFLIFWYFACLDITVVVTWSLNYENCCASLCFGHFWVFLKYLVLNSSNSTEPSNIFDWIFLFESVSYWGSYKITVVCMSVREWVISFSWFFAWC